VCKRQYIYLSRLDVQHKIAFVKQKSILALEQEYDRLRKSLTAIGYISQGSVLDRSQLKTPRAGYQWTRKVSRKTITLALSSQQFEALRKAVQNRKSLDKTLQQMESISRKILFATSPDTRRRKQLTKKTLGIN